MFINIPKTKRFKKGIHDDYNMNYDALLKKAQEELPETLQDKNRFEIPQVIGHIEGNRTIITNFFKIAKTLERDPDHLLKFILKELAAPGKVDKQRLILGTKIASSTLNAKIKQYTLIYVLCSECGKPDTKIIKEKRSSSLICQACGASHPVRLL